MHDHEGEAPAARPMYPAELLADPTADAELDAAAGRLISTVGQVVGQARKAEQRAWAAEKRDRAGRLVDELLAEFPEPADLLALRSRFDSWGEVNVPVTVQVPVVAAGYLRAAGVSAAEALTLGLALIVSGTPVELVELLGSPTADGAVKRAAGTKPHWKTEDPLAVHAEAMYRHLDAWNEGGRWPNRLEFTPDAESGAHPLAHVAWRALAVAWLEREARA